MILLPNPLLTSLPHPLETRPPAEQTGKGDEKKEEEKKGEKNGISQFIRVPLVDRGPDRPALTIENSVFGSWFPNPRRQI